MVFALDLGAVPVNPRFVFTNRSLPKTPGFEVFAPIYPYLSSHNETYVNLECGGNRTNMQVRVGVGGRSPVVSVDATARIHAQPPRQEATTTWDYTTHIEPKYAL